MIRKLLYFLFMLLPPARRLDLARWRFQAVREAFYRETRLDVAAKGLRNRETLLERLDTLAQRHRRRRALYWPVFAAIAHRMREGDDFAQAIRRFVPKDEYALFELAGSSTREDAAVRGFSLAEMAARAKGVLSSTTSAQMAYPVFLLVYLYGFCMLFGGAIFPQVAQVHPVSQWGSGGAALYAFDTACYAYWWLTGSVVVALVLAYFATLQRWTGAMRNRLDNAPLMWRNRRDLRAALLIVSLAGLFDSGLTLRAALNRLETTADLWLRWHLRRMGRRLTETPDAPMRALDTGVFSEEIVDTITDAAGRDQFVAAIKALGQDSLERVVAAVKRNARITHYVLLSIAAAAFIALGVGSYVVTGAVGLTGASMSTMTH